MNYLYTIYWTCTFKKSLWNKVIHMIFASFINLPNPKLLKNIVKSARNSCSLNIRTGANQPKFQILFKKKISPQDFTKRTWVSACSLSTCSSFFHESFIQGSYLLTARSNCLMYYRVPTKNVEISFVEYWTSRIWMIPNEILNGSQEWRKV